MRPKGGIRFYRSLWSVLFVQPVVGPWVQGLPVIWTLLHWIWSFKSTKMGQVRMYGNVTEMLRPKGGFSFNGSLRSVLFAQPVVGAWGKGHLVHGRCFHGLDQSRTRNAVKFDCMATYLNCCVPKADYHLWKPTVCTIRTAISASLSPRVSWYMDLISLDMIIQEHAKGVKSDCMAV